MKVLIDTNVVVDVIITRNLDDYKASDISCMSPTAFIAYLKDKENL